MTTYLKHKFARNEMDIHPTDVEYLLPQGKKFFSMFDSSNSKKLSEQ